MSMTKEDIEDIFSHYFVIEPPKHVIVLNKDAIKMDRDKIIFLKGFQPKDDPDIVFITPRGDDETAIHEAIHTMGFSELGARTLGRLFIMKYRILKLFPWISRRRRPVRYEETATCSKCSRFIEKNLLVVPPDGVLTHYELVTSGAPSR